MSSNLPPGVTESMIPGNRPQDVEAQRYAESLTEDDLLDWIEEHAIGDLIWEADDELGGWRVEAEEGGLYSPIGGEWIPFRTKEDCIALLLCERWDWIEEQLIEAHLEEPPDEPDYEPHYREEEY